MNKFKKLLIIKCIQMLCVLVCYVLTYMGYDFIKITIVLMAAGMFYDIFLIAYLLILKKMKKIIVNNQIRVVF